MSLTITIPDDLAEHLQDKAQAQNRSVDEMILSLLEESLSEETFPTPEEVVAKIKATLPNPNCLRSASGSLAQYLSMPVTPDSNFDLEEWQRQWNVIETEMKAVDRANDLAEGRL